MQIYTGLCYSKKYVGYFRRYHLGMMLSTSAHCWVREWFNEFSLALDNGAFGAWTKGKAFPEASFLFTLDNCDRYHLELDFVVVPDLVAQGKASLEFSLDWTHHLDGWPLALALQDGMAPQDILPYHHLFDVIFLGGTVKWKWRTLTMWKAFADSIGKPLHIGRCGSLEGLKRAKALGVASVDSTNFIRDGRSWVLAEYSQPRQLELEFPS